MPTNVAAMKAMVADDTVQQVRWGYRGGFGLSGRPGLPRRRRGYRGGWGYRRWAGVAAGAIVGGRSRAAPITAAIRLTVTAAYGYGGYYGGGYGGYYGGGYGGYYPAYAGYADDGYGGYPAYSYRRYYGW